MAGFVWLEARLWTKGRPFRPEACPSDVIIDLGGHGVKRLWSEKGAAGETASPAAPGLDILVRLKRAGARNPKIRDTASKFSCFL